MNLKLDEYGGGHDVDGCLAVEKIVVALLLLVDIFSIFAWAALTLFFIEPGTERGGGGASEVSRG